MIFNTYEEANPYAKGIVRLAPIKESKETANLLIDNIVLGYVRDTTVDSSTVGTYYINTGENWDNPVFQEVHLPEDGFDSTLYYFKFEKDVSNLLEPIRDITEICGINPSDISYSKNTMSSELTGRVLNNLNMQKDILGRVWDTTLTFSLLSSDKMKRLDDFFMNKTETFNVTQENASKEVTRYVIWYYMELSTPTGIIKDIFYVGDSSFTDVETHYKVIKQPNGKLGTTSYGKGVKINLIGKSSIGGIKNSDYQIST
jgi:hypothetical protein